MASRTLGTLEGNPAAELAAFRAGVHGLFLALVWHDSFSALGALPSTLMRPPGIMQYFGWRFFDRLLTPEGMVVLKLALLISLSMSTLGWWSWATTKSSAFLVVLYEGLLHSFTGVGQRDMAGVTIVILLAFLPCGDTFSVDSLAAPP